ncbi:MAG: DUF2914 domain-containing protein [Bdellovibrionales bacterium]|nr:DUF2914 domain-containing protein [Bdellovibrionales bacterium]
MLTFLNFKDLSRKGLPKNVLIKQMIIPSISLSIIFSFLYLAKILPPVPLAAKYMGIYHSIKKIDNQYKLGYTRSRWRFWQSGDQTFYARSGDKIICFVRVFAPGTIEQNIKFRWEFYQAGEWIMSDNISINIQGGRERGYRGYVTKSNFQEGEWRVKLENEDGREISRIYFEVKTDNSSEIPEYKYNYH